MPIDDLTALGQKMRGARKNKELTQQELSDLSHVSVKQIVILSILVDTFISKISFPMQPGPEIGSISDA